MAADAGTAGTRTAESGLLSMWTCPKCGETIEESFASCWKCSTWGHGAAPAAFEQDVFRRAGAIAVSGRPVRPVVFWGFALLVCGVLLFPAAVVLPRFMLLYWELGKTKVLLHLSFLYVGLVGVSGVLLSKLVGRYLRPEMSRSSRNHVYAFVAAVVGVLLAIPWLDAIAERHDREMQEKFHAEKCPDCGEYSLKHEGTEIGGFILSLDPLGIEVSPRYPGYYVCGLCGAAFRKRGHHDFFKMKLTEDKKRNNLHEEDAAPGNKPP